ncbi:MAG: YhcH/YjgK/YiaL family protein [Fusobacteriaceae bacterium]
MFFDKIKEIKKYKGISVNLDKAIDFIIAGKHLKAEVGKHMVDGENIFFMVQEYTTKKIEDAFFETHETYADIQIMIQGEEGFGYSFIENLKETDSYIAEKDVAKQKGNSDFILPLKNDNFVFVFPREPHMPTLACDNIPKAVKKVIFKIKF